MQQPSVPAHFAFAGRAFEPHPPLCWSDGTHRIEAARSSSQLIWADGSGFGVQEEKWQKCPGTYRALPGSMGRLQTGSARAQLSLDVFAAGAAAVRTYSRAGPGRPLLRQSEDGAAARPPSSDPVLVPSYAAWFDLNKVRASVRTDRMQFHRGFAGVGSIPNEAVHRGSTLKYPPPNT